ncbi:MAG: hypothetical protein HQ536_01100 [Parcubacteria group bacterium]|nr:hypothetical protein [Parcubacteria group bacterium]
METNKIKRFRSEAYNYDFNRQTGFFARWGKTHEDDPERGPFPEILDIEISTICSGPNGKNCKFCYKTNTPKGKNMTIETFKKLFEKFPKKLTQIACGIGDISTTKYYRKKK